MAEQPKLSVGIKSVLAGLFVMALLVAQIASLTSQNSHLQKQLNLNVQHARKLSFVRGRSNARMTRSDDDDVVAHHYEVPGEIDVVSGSQQSSNQVSCEELQAENLALLTEQLRLENQIKQLTANLDDYQDLLDQHADLNDQLDQSTAELQAEIDRLAAENEIYKQLNGELTNSIDDLKEQTSELQKQNEILAGLNDDLNATTIKLNNTIDDLEDQVDRLSEQNDVLSSEIDRLSNETDRLEVVNGQLEQSIANLTAEVDRFANKIEELQKMNNELQNIVSFVNETGQFLDQNLEEVTEYLSEQIVAYRSVATETIQNTYIQRSGLWDCQYHVHFGDYQFSKNHKLEIPIDMVDEVLDFVNDRVLQELCLDLDDFEKFMDAEFESPSLYTTDHLVAGIASYTHLAFDYYFPDTGESGLTKEDWALAGYNCENLRGDQHFFFDENDP